MKFEDFNKRIKVIQEAMVSLGIAVNDKLEKWGRYTDAVKEVLGQNIGYHYRPGEAWRIGKDLWVCPDSDGYWLFKNYADLTDDDVELFCKQHGIYDLVPDFVVPNRVNSKSIIQDDEDEDFVI